MIHHVFIDLVLLKFRNTLRAATNVDSGLAYNTCGDRNGVDNTWEHTFGSKMRPSENV